MASRRKAKNLISCHQNDQDKWISDSRDLTNQVTDHFRSIYVEDNSYSIEGLISSLASVNLPCLSESDQQRLMQLFSLEELKEAVFDLPSNSALGPDGFNAKSYQSQWHLINQDLFKAANPFGTLNIFLKILIRPILC